MALMKEFKEFAMKGNLVEMAVAFVLGAAFSSVISGFINGMVMPLVGMLTAGVDFQHLKYVLSAAEIDAAGTILRPESAILYGQFITIVIDFLLVAFVMILVVKAVNRANRKKQAETPVPAVSEEQKLLAEIRDLLKK